MSALPGCAAIAAACASLSEAMLRLSAIRYDAGSWLMTTRSQAMPPHDQRRSACASERSRPKPWATPAETRTIGRSPEMPKRQSRRRSQTSPASEGAQVGARERERQRRRQRLDRREVLGVDAHLAQADAGQRRRHQRGALDVAELAVLVDHRAQRRRVVGGGGAERQPHLRLGRDLQPHRERRDRIEAGVERRAVAVGGAAAGGSSKAASGWLASRLRPSQRWRSTWIRIETFAGSASARKLAATQALVGRQARLPREHDRLVVRLPLGAHEQVRERRMRFVGARVGERDLERRQQLEVERALAAVVQDDAAELDVVFRADPDRRRRFELGPGRAEGDPVGVEAAVVVRRRIGRRMLRQRDRARLPVPAHVEEPAVGVAQRVVARARDRRRCPSGSRPRRWRAGRPRSGRSRAGGSARSPSCPAAPRGTFPASASAAGWR